MAALVETATALLPAQPSAAPAWHPGDVATLVVRVGHETGSSVAWPSREDLSSALDGKATVVDEGGAAPAEAAPLSSSAAVDEARAWHVQLLVAPGDREIPGIPVRLVAADGSEVAKETTAPIPVTVSTVLDAATVQKVEGVEKDAEALKQATTAALAPARGPWSLKGQIPLWWFLAALALGLASALLFGLWWRKRRRPRVRAAAPPELAEVVARRRLKELREGALLQRGGHLAFHVELADILKEYLERRLGADLRERTTDEIKRAFAGALKGTRHVTDIRSDVVSVLSSCDLVKFARSIPPPSEALELVTVVERLVTRTTEAAPAPAKPPMTSAMTSPGGAT
jgi:hypothetical protein